MRLIDADAAITVAKKYYCNGCLANAECQTCDAKRMVDEMKEIPVGADLTKSPTIGTYKQNTELAEAFQKAMKESPHVLVIPKKPRWIPCSERLPEKDGYYLVCTDGTKNNKIDIAEFYIFADFVPKEIANNYWNKASKVLYWMPLPEPPESEVHDDDER